MRSYLSTLIILIAVTATLLGCGRESQRETRFLKDRKVIIEMVQSCFQRPYEGLSRLMPQEVPTNLGFPGEDHIHMNMRSGGKWYGDDQWEVSYRPAGNNGSDTNLPIDMTKLFNFYFGKLEASGFTSGVQGVPVTILDSMQAASKSWANPERTLLVTGHVVSNRRSGETIITIILRETIKR
jgi:hypothetical protein